jgi:putative ABC transport system permease protein
LLESLHRELAYSWRALVRSPGFSAVALLTLAIGIGANTAIFSFVDGVLLKPLPYPDADRIVRVLEKPPRGERNGISTLNFLDWQHDNQVFDFMAAQAGGAVTLTGGSEPVQIRGGRVSAHYFDIFGIHAALGRTFQPGEDALGDSHVVILSHALWVRQFGADRAILNRTILLDNEAYAVIGILPAGGAFDRSANQLWRPLSFEPANMTRDFHWLTSFARLKPGVSLDQAKANMSAIGARIERDFPASNKGWGVVVESYADTLVGSQIRTALLVLLTATGLMLLIGCANLANLALARGVAREREVAIRASLGASRWQLVREFLTENVLLSIGGGMLGLVVGYATTMWLQTLVPPFAFAREAEIAIDARALAFAALVSVGTGLIFGSAPAWQATSPHLTALIKDGGRGATSGVARGRLRDALIMTEVALAFVLLVGSGLMMRSFFRLLNVNAGFETANALTIGVPITTRRFPDPDRLNLYLREIQAAVSAVPGVLETALSCAPPLQGACYGMPMQVAGRPVVDRATRAGGFFKIVSASYFSALKLTMASGRPLSDRDDARARNVLVINERLAKREFGSESPIGQRLLIQQIVPGQTQLGPDVAWEIVGVVRDEKVNGMADEQSAGVYVTNEQSPAYFQTLIVKTTGNPLTFEKPIAAAIHRIDQDQALIDVRSIEQIKELSMATTKLQSVLLAVFGAVSLLLAGIGIYGVISYSVAQRTHEIGIRAALGAPRLNLLNLILSRGLILATVGLMVGLLGSLALTRLMTAILYGVEARDPATMAAVAGVLASVAATACYIPARRATKVDPIIALRIE